MVGDAKNLHILNLGMAIEKFLDLARVEVFAAADHHVLDAAEDVAVPLLVDHRDVAGMHPAIGIEHVGGLFRLIPIAKHDAVAASAQFAGVAAGHNATLEIDDLNLDVRMNASDSRHPALKRIVSGALETGWAGLGHAIADSHLAHVHQLINATHYLDRAWRAGHHTGPQRGQVEFGEVWMVEFGDEHRRHPVEGRAFFPLDRL